MSGSDKIPAFDRYHSDLRFFGQSPFLSSPNVTATVAPAPHPFIAHFYPLVAGNERPSHGFPRSVNPIHQPSSAAALVALAASGYVDKNFSNDFLKKFQKVPFKTLHQDESSLQSTLPPSEGPPVKKPRHQFDLDVLSNHSQHPVNHLKPISQDNALLHYPGISGLNPSPFHSAWQNFIRRCRNVDSSSDLTVDQRISGTHLGSISDSVSPFSSASRNRFSSDSAVPLENSVSPVNLLSTKNHMPDIKPAGNNHFSSSWQRSKRIKLSAKQQSSTLTNASLSPSQTSTDEEKAEKESDDHVDVPHNNQNDAGDCLIDVGSPSSPHGSGIVGNNAKTNDSTISTNERCSSASSDQLNKDSQQRKRKPRHGLIGDICPVCGLTVRTSDLQSHLQQEIEKLQRLPSETLAKHELSRRPSQDRRSNHGPFSTSSMSVAGKKFKEITVRSERNNRAKTYEKVCNNRVERFNTKVGRCLRIQRNMAGPSSSALPGFRDNAAWTVATNWSTHFNSLPSNCPVCCTQLIGSLSEMHEHIGRCLRQRNVSQQLDVDDAVVDVESNDLPPFINATVVDHGVDLNSDKSFCAELDWCGRRRMNSELMDGSDPASMTAFQIGKLFSLDEDSDKELNVETDDTLSYGPVQFADRDLIPTKSNVDSKQTGNFCRKSSCQLSDDSPSPSGDENSNAVEELAALRSKIEKLECEKQATLCMICMDAYKDPLTSVQCWHVHCERCWMQALAVKKLCPQCNAITHPNKLRRIFL